VSNPRILNRKLHRWGALAIALPFLVVLVSGVLLQVKKQVAWVQPPEQRSDVRTPVASFDQLLTAAQSIPEAGVRTWDDVDRLDVRPGKGIVKLQSLTSWEIQLDLETARVLQVAYRRTDLIESLHDGSWFSEPAKLWVFLPSALIVTALWVTGMYMALVHYRAKARRRRA
jgi:uncharacterized iron-regulated membrane protein